MSDTAATPTLFVENVVLTSRPSIWRRLGRTAKAQPVGVFGLFLSLLLLFIVVFGPYIQTHDPNELGADLLASPSSEHWFGTDLRGRDYFSRTMEGGRITVSIAFLALALGTVAGTVFGMISAYSRPLDLILQRVVDAVMALPGLFLILLFIVVFGGDYKVLIMVIGIGVTFPLTRIARGAALTTLTNPYIEAAEVSGATGTRILFRHLLPNIAPTIGVVFAVGVGNVMLTTGSLGFLGLGVDPPQAEWGRMIAESRSLILSDQHLFIFPAIGLAIAVLGVNLLGDSLRDLWDPRMRGA